MGAQPVSASSPTISWVGWRHHPLLPNVTQTGVLSPSPKKMPSTLEWNTVSSGRLSLTLHQLTEHPLCAAAASSASPTQTPSNPLHLHYSANSDFPIDKFHYCMFLLYQTVLQACNLKPRAIRDSFNTFQSLMGLQFFSEWSKKPEHPF